MIFKKAHRDTPFIQIDKAVYEDDRVSYKAKGILTYLVGKPEDWTIYETEIAEHTPEGIKSIRSGIKELIKCGYIIKTEIRNEKGQFIGNEWLVYDIPTANPKTECRKKHTTNIDNTNIDNDVVKLKYQKKHKDGTLTDYQAKAVAEMANIENIKKRKEV